MPLPSSARHLPHTNIAGQLLSAPVLCRGTGARGCRAAPRLCWSSGCRGGGSHLGTPSPEGRGFAGGRAARGMPQRKGSALHMVRESFLILLSTTMLSEVSYQSLQYPGCQEIFLVGGISLCQVFPCQRSQTTSLPLCTGPAQTCLSAGHWLGAGSCPQGEKGSSERP